MVLSAVSNKRPFGGLITHLGLGVGDGLGGLRAVLVGLHGRNHVRVPKLNLFGWLQAFAAVFLSVARSAFGLRRRAIEIRIYTRAERIIVDKSGREKN